MQNTVTLYRNNKIISSFLSAFGNDIKETRVTAALGYLLSYTPKSFLNLFEIKNEIINIIIEEIEENGRVDIKIETINEKIDIEAKIQSIDPLKQSLKYKGIRKILLTNFIPTKEQKEKKNIKYINWQEIYYVLKNLRKNNKVEIKFLSSEIIKYLIQHNMVKTEKPTEIYLREINDVESYKLFIRGQLYNCRFVINSNLYKAIYFAPHFGEKLSCKYEGVENGISWIARIEELQIAENWDHMLESVKSKRKKQWVKNNGFLLDYLKINWKNEGDRRIIFFLGEPIRAFNPPINKNNLQGGKGWLSKTFLSFDELFKARKEKIY